MEDSRYTLDELVARLAAEIDEAALEPTNGQVQAVPDRRTLRYYTTLGVLDRPELSGRQAFYGRRHLLQALAIKRLQAEGLGLAAVQRRLAGLPDAELAAVARPAGTAARPERFWAGAPAAAPPAGRPRGTGPALPPSAPVPAPAAPGTRAPRRRSPTSTPPTGASLLSGLPLGDGAVLLLPASPALAAADSAALAAVQVAAAPLLAHLRRTGLLAPGDH